MVAVGEAEGIHFAFDRIGRTPNTLDAHRLVGLAEKQGVQDTVVEALFRAYFTEGRDISSRQTLLDVVAEAGLDRHRAEVGYWLAKPFWGRGIITAVVQRVCRHAFEEFGLAKITAHVFPHNPASARVLEKCGFQQEGFLRKHFLKDGQFVDARLFGLLR